MSILPSRCTGLATGEEVASLEYDIVHPAVLYAATTQGRVLVARVVSDGTRLDCRVLRRMPEPVSAQHEAQPDSDGQLDENPAQLGVVKGHVLSADTTALRIYNTTKVQLRGGSSSIAVLTRSHFATGNADLQLGHAPLLVANPRASEGFVVLCSRDGKLIVFESLLPFVEDEWDLSQTRLPVLAGAVMLVFGKRAQIFVVFTSAESDLLCAGYQMFKRKKKLMGSSSSDRFGGGDSSEMASLERHLSASRADRTGNLGRWRDGPSREGGDDSLRSFLRENRSQRR